MLKNLAAQARRLLGRPKIAASEPVERATPAAAPPVQPASSTGITFTKQTRDVDVFASIQSPPAPTPPRTPTRPLPSIQAAAVQSTAPVAEEIPEDARLQRDLDAKLEALEQKRNDMDANQKRWDGMIQKKAAAVLSKKRAHSPFAAHPTHEPASDSPPSPLGSAASQHSTSLPHNTLSSAASDAHPKH